MNTFQWLLQIQGLLFDMQVKKTETDEELRNVLTSNNGLWHSSSHWISSCSYKETPWDKADILRYVHVIFSLKGYSILVRSSYFVLVFSMPLHIYNGFWYIYTYMYTCLYNRLYTFYYYILKSLKSAKAFKRLSRILFRLR